MPFTPPALPSNLPTLLSSLRSPIFQTLHNPTSSRLGTKYLRHRMRGPSMVDYYPVVPSLNRLNNPKSYNIYANWQGLPQPNDLLSARDKERKGEERVAGLRWRARVLTGKDVTEGGFEEMERVKGAGWLWDEKEDGRVKKVARRRRIGKGPPKKGESGRMSGLDLRRFW